MDRLLKPDHARMINMKAREVLSKYYKTRGVDEFHEVSELLTTLQDHGVSPEELPIMDEMRDVIIGKH